MGVKKRKNEVLGSVFTPIRFLTNVLLIKPCISGYKDRVLHVLFKVFFNIS
ncbi:hypothetical protein SAMN04487898_11644 [Pedobacter sp. ok626]|nr:hypothetical protein SAMN04487898_11644 [Pedobacter sp. ok626]